MVQEEEICCELGRRGVCWVWWWGESGATLKYSDAKTRTGRHSVSTFSVIRYAARPDPIIYFVPSHTSGRLLGPGSQMDRQRTRGRTGRGRCAGSHGGDTQLGDIHSDMKYMTEAYS
jgi:hypothetical protein